MFIRNAACPPPLELVERHREEKRYMFHHGVICGFIAGAFCGLLVGLLINRPPRRRGPIERVHQQAKRKSRKHGPKIVNLDW